MTRYDYQYQRRIQHGRSPPHRRRFQRISNKAVYNLIIGTIIGFGFGLWYSWEIEPVIILDHSPSNLESSHYSEYVLMIAQTFRVDQDIDLARARLGTLSKQRSSSIASDQAEKMILTGANHADIQVMAELAAAQGMITPALESYLP